MGYIDLHCHPATKPLGKSFRKKSSRYQNTTRKRSKNSIWHMDRAGWLERVIQQKTSLTKFSQADVQTLALGQVRVASASLYPLEKGFVFNKLGTGIGSDALLSLVASLPKKRLDHITSMGDYYTDLEGERDFYKQLDGTDVQLDRGKYRYRLVHAHAELEHYLNTEPTSVLLFFSIEGGHVFDCGLPGKTAVRQHVLDRVEQVKAWDERVFWITLGHHFKNELCGHARSLSGAAGGMLNQDDGLGQGIASLGYDVIERLLGSGPQDQILIDLKHMSPQSRADYYALMEANYSSRALPILFSHAAPNGRRSRTQHLPSNPWTSPLLKDGEPVGEINVYDEELIRIAQSNGLIGLQLDERRIASPQAMRDTRRKEGKDPLFYRSRLLWNNVRHVAETLDQAGFFAWDNMAIGSDFDGTVDPINGFWTAEFMPLLEVHLQEHAYNYLEGDGKRLKDYNRIDPNAIVDRLMSTNALAFLARYF